MDLTKSQLFYFLTAFTIVAVYSIYLQQTLLLHWDVSWMLHAASSILEGGTYSKDYFEIAPPTNLLLFTPAILISKIFSLSIITAVRAYVFTIGFISLACCYQLIKKLLLIKDAKLGLAFIISLEIAYFILPIQDFGQKEHLFFIFVMPYLLLMACRTQEMQIDSRTATWIGLFSGLGIAIKPSFLMFPLFLELYYVVTCKKVSTNYRKWLLLFRPETCAIFCVFFTYAIVTIIYFPDYLTVVAPYALRWNYASMAVPWVVLYKQKIIWVSLLIYSFYAIQYHNTTYKQLTSVLAIAVLAAILSYFSQRTIFPYHIYPILAFDCLLSTLLLGCYISAGINNNNHAYSLIGFLIAALVIFFSHFLDYALFICVLFPQYFFGFFILVLVFMLYFSGSHKINFIIGPLIVISGGLLVRHLAMATDSGTFIALMLYLTCLFLLLGRKTNINTSHFMISATLVTLFFVFPYVDRLYLYQVRLLKDKEFRTLIAFTDRYAVHHSVYFFSTLIEHVPVVDYCKDTTTAMRLPFFWMLPAMVRQGETTPNYISDKHFLINMITEDFRNKKPYLVFVDVSKHKPFLFSPKTNEYAHFEFLPFFLSETTFAEEWKKYHYLTSVKFEGHKTDVELDSDRKFAVYQRSDI